MNPLLSSIEAIYIRKKDLINLLRHETDPEKSISKMVEQNDLMMLQEDFFVIPEKMKQAPDPWEQISNLLYEPSYVSLEWALAYYSMIPEAVFNVTSVTINPALHIITPLCLFMYSTIPYEAYDVGIHKYENSIGGFLMATPEKAVADIVYLKSNDLEPDELLEDLIEGRRIDDSDLRRLNKDHLQEIANKYQSKDVFNLLLALKKL